MSSDHEKFIRWNVSEKVAKVSHELSLLEALVKDKAPINHTCGGYGTCGTCLVTIEGADILSERNDLELDMATDRGFASDERLACQVLASEVIENKLTVKIPTSNL